MGITKKQKAVFDYIRDYHHTHGFSPTQEEIKDHFGFKSLGSVQKYLQYLANAGHLRMEKNACRGLEPIDPDENPDQTSSHDYEIPLLGRVAAGKPIEATLDNEVVSVPPHMLKGRDHYALEVKGDSMIEEGILDGDTIVVTKADRAHDGQIVVAVIDNEATLKKFYKRKNQFELHPANSRLKPIIVKQGDFKIQGILVGLLRRYS